MGPATGQPHAEAETAVVIAALLGGLLAGYGIAMPVGAVGTYLASLTARTSLKIGASAALGIATADGLYALIASFTGSALAPLIQRVILPLRWGAVAVLITLAVRSALLAMREYRSRDVPAAGTQGPPARLARAYLTFLGITLANPLTVIYFTALVLGSQPAGAPDYPGRAVFAIAAFAASASWQLLLAGGGALLGRALTGDRGRFTTALASSAVMTALAVHVLIASA